MLETNAKGIYPDLMEIINLFGCDSAITFAVEENGELISAMTEIDGKSYFAEYPLVYADELEHKRFYKRYSKLALYRALEAHTGRAMPWGALTGIRPVKLCYGHLNDYMRFLTEEMCVSTQKAELCDAIVKAQRGIYSTDANNCDLYVGIPFCPTRCSYCSFVSCEISKVKSIEGYVTALIAEIEAAKGLVGNLRSVYIGGGTPVSLPIQQLTRIFECLGRQSCEFTVEAGRPDAITSEHLDLFEKYGVTRVCVNPQTFCDKTLELIGRKHTAADIAEKYAMVSERGFSVNMDLIAGLPGEDLNIFKHSIDTAVGYSPDNITVHTLCLKHGSKLKESTDRLDDGDIAAMVEYAHSALREAGYEPYYLYRQKYMKGNQENTGYAKPNRLCIYNVDIMEETAQNIACGAGAVSKRVFGGGERIERYGAPKDVGTYIAKIDEIIAEKTRLFA